MVIDPWDHPFNGTVVSTRRFIGALADDGFQLRLLTIGSEPAVPGCERVGFPRLYLPIVNRIIEQMRAPLARPVRKRLEAALAGCDLLHVQYPFLLGHAAIGVARRLGIPVLCSFHVQPENILRNIGLDRPRLRRLLYRTFIRAIYERADRVLAPSPFAAELLREAGLTRPISVISNGVPEALLEQPRAAPREGPLQILAVGRLAPEKGHGTLLEALGRCSHRHRLSVTLIGTGPRLRALREQAAQLELDARIGPVDDATLHEQYASADLFVHCGAVELEGMSVLEAMATGNAVLVADAPGSAAAGLVRDPAWRFPADDVDALSARIDHWLADPDARRTVGETNRRQAAEHAHRRSVSRLAELYRTLTDQRAPRPCAA